MRSRPLQMGVVLLMLATVGVLPRIARSGELNFPDSPALEHRIQRVENGLLPATVVQGEPPLRMKLSERMKFYRTPGVSIAVINNGKLEWARGYGYRSVDNQQAVTTETIFQAASISKPLTAVAVLRLVEQGKLGLDDDVNKHLTTWKVPYGDSTKNEGRTIRRVLSHTSGFTVSGFLGYSSDQPVPGLLQILDGKPPANSAPIRVDIAPGTKYRYSGGGYVVLQQLLMDVTKTSFSELMQPIFRTLRMRHSSFESPPPSGNFASGHLPDGKVIAGGWHSYPELAAAGLWTTPSDLAQFMVELQKSANGKSKRLLSPNAATQMLTPQIENAGLGLMIDGKDASRRFSFSGSNVGYKAFMVGYMNSSQGAVVMTNAESGAPLALEILRSVAAEYGWPDYRPRERVITKVNSAIFSDYIGEYELAPGAVVTITRVGDKLMSRAPGQPEAELLPESPGTFFLREVDASFTFVKDDAGRVVQVTIRRGGREFQAKRIRKD
jgi:CubicO group peptidase (beta-lactamase class C family)